MLNITVRYSEILRKIPNIADMECLLWYSNLTMPAITTVKNFELTGGMGKASNGNLNPFLLSCEVDTANGIPEAVSLIGRRNKYDKKCSKKATNCLQLIQKGFLFFFVQQMHFLRTNFLSNAERDQNVPKLAVCVKGVSFSNPIMVFRLIEWIELLNLLGVGKIFFHYTNIAPVILDMLIYYKNRGYISLQEFVWAGPYSK